MWLYVYSFGKSPLKSKASTERETRPRWQVYDVPSCNKYNTRCKNPQPNRMAAIQTWWLLKKTKHASFTAFFLMAFHSSVTRNASAFTEDYEPVSLFDHGQSPSRLSNALFVQGVFKYWLSHHACKTHSLSCHGCSRMSAEGKNRGSRYASINLKKLKWGITHKAKSAPPRGFGVNCFVLPPKRADHTSDWLPRTYGCEGTWECQAAWHVSAVIVPHVFRIQVKTSSPPRMHSCHTVAYL